MEGLKVKWYQKLSKQTFKDIFHNSLVNTVDGWCDILSVVIPERNTKEELK